MTINTFLFENKDHVSGPRLLIFGAIHGNESCGPIAIDRVIDKIKSGAISIERGSVRFVPVCNERAYRENKRFVEQDLNRIFKKSDTPESYESLVANELCALMETGTDAFLDVHSSTATGPTSVFIDYPTPENKAFAEALGTEYALLDWPKVYEENVYGFDSYDTTRYAYNIGITGVIVECGQHQDLQTAIVAEEIILRALTHFKIISALKDKTSLGAPRSIYMKSLEKKIAAEDVFEKEWKHLEALPAGTHIATRASGEALYAKHDCVMILPKLHAKPGGEWFYLGTAV